MQYLADFLTLIRLVLTIGLFVLAVIDGAPGWAFVVFVLAELTDAFDGSAAKKWPFPKNKVPRYRKYAAKYDMLVDSLLGIAMMVYFTSRINLVTGAIIIVTYGVVAMAVDLVVYGKLFGHPDDFKPHSLMDRDFNRAKKLILARRMVYLSLIALIAAWTLYSSDWPLPIKIMITAIAFGVAVFLWGFLAQRRRYISRDAVKIEKRLAQKRRR